MFLVRFVSAVPQQELWIFFFFFEEKGEKCIGSGNKCKEMQGIIFNDLCISFLIYLFFKFEIILILQKNFSKSAPVHRFTNY